MILYIILAIIAYVIYSSVWKPWRLHKWYAEGFRRQGYKVLEVPFRPFAASYLDYYNMSKDADDALKVVKEQYPNYDVVIFNFFNTIFIDYCHPDLHQEFLSAEKASNYSKVDVEFDNFKRFMGDGLFLS